MYPRRSSRRPKASERTPQRSPSPNEDIIQRRLRGKRQTTGPRKTRVDHSVVNTDEGRDRDIIDIINSDQDSIHVAEEDEGKFVEVADAGVDKSDDEDCHSVASSIASGPSLPYNTSAEKLRPQQSVCSACRKLYQKAKKMKAPIKNKLLDNDPKSLTCDQWVLIKNWRPSRLPNAGGKLLTHVRLVKKRLQVMTDARRTEQCVGEATSCSRPHTFLQRNLRRVRVPIKRERKKSRRKRTRNDSQGPRVAKQQRLHSSNHRQHMGMDGADNGDLYPASGHSSSPGFEGCSEQEMEDSGDTDLTVEVFSTTVTLEQPTKPREDSPKKKVLKKTGGFRDLLAQLRGNSSMIVRETR